MKKIWVQCGSALLVLLITVTVWGKVPEMSSILLQAHNAKQPIPVLSRFYPDLDVKTAYEVQKKFVTRQLAGDAIGGFQAGLTNENSRKQIGFPSPIAGVLYRSGQKENNVVIHAADFRCPAIETEIAFTISKPIVKKIRTKEELKEYIQAVLPVVALTEQGFADNKKVRGVDLIAANVSAVRYITGRAKMLNDIQDPNAVKTALFHAGQRINEGMGLDAMGDQWEAALWLVNRSVEQGWNLQPGQILLTGVLGQAVPAKNGRYMADYGELGRIAFTIQ
ncbi:2-keto-4-pentenoate hydratase [Lucifera butyrica]|uniref:2-keto-4-pentenoate hydratase n=1 Tax=Lucifera butyrica TaxID=1351585 RepID=UPI000F02FD3F|nr:fumarylacetoacetate hydrolase family protein [Lucifera butyrica]